MQGNNPGGNDNKQNGSGSPAQGGLSWTQPAAGGTPVTKPVTPVSVGQQQKPTPPRSNNSGAKQNNGWSGTRGYFIGGIVIAALIVWGVYAYRSSGTGALSGATSTNSTLAGTSSNAKVSNVTTTKGSSAATKTTVSIPASAQFNAGDQKAGTKVVVSNVRVPAPVWLVIYDSVGGAPGRVLGAAMAFPEYNGKSVEVPLLRTTLSGHSYLVGVSVDNGDHIFSLDSDTKMVDVNKKLITTSFQTN